MNVTNFHHKAGSQIAVLPTCTPLKEVNLLKVSQYDQTFVFKRS